MDDIAPRSFSTLPVEDAALSLSDIRSIVGVLLRHWKLILAVPVLATAVTYAALKVVPPLYKSTVEILVVDPKRPTNAAEERRLSPFEVDEAAMSSEVQVLLSKGLALRVAKELALEKDPEFLTSSSRLRAFLKAIGVPWVMNRLGWSWQSAEPPIDANDGVNAGAELDRAAEELRQHHLTVDRVQFSYVLSLAVTSMDPQKSQRIAAALANMYLNDQLEARYDAARRATQWLTGRLDDLRGRVRETETQIEKLKAENGLSDTGSGANVAQQEMSDLNNQLALARTQVFEERAHYDQAQRILQARGDIQSIPEVIASPVIGQLRAQQVEVSRQLADLSARFDQRYPKLINMRRQLQDIDNAINEEVRRIVGNLKNEYEVALQREQSLRKTLAQLTEQRGNSKAAIQLGELQRIDEVNRKLYESFLSMFGQIEQRSTLSDMGARIITPATLPSQPSSPRYLLTFALVIVASTVTGIGLAFMSEHLKTGFHTSTQIERMFGHPVLGMIPVLPRPFFRAPSRRHDILNGMIAAPLSRLSERIRGVRMGLMITDREKSSRTILVTSAVPGEGKSMMAVLLAASCAGARKRTLLIDCDLRRKSISQMFGRADKVGLIEVLEGEVGIDDAIAHDQKTGVAMLGAGSGVVSPADILNSDRMHDVLAELRQDYDCIVLDASPLLPVVDAVVLSKLVEQTLVVVEWKRTPRISVVEALKALGDEARIAGVVVNKVNYARLRTYGYGIGSGYNHGSYYRHLDKYYETP